MKIFKKPFRESFSQNILLIAGILVTGYALMMLVLNLATRHSQELSVPDFSGMKMEAAMILAAEKEIRIEVTDSVYIRGMGRGVISRQNPEPGSKVKKGRRILVVINSVVPRQSEVPSVIGYSLRQAKTELIASGLSVGKLLYVEDMATNNVLAQQYKGKDIEPGTKLDSDSQIDLVLGMNPTHNETYIPNVIGYKYLFAKEIIHDNSLNIYRMEFDNTVGTYSDSLEAMVYSQYPAPSDSIPVRMGSAVTLYLSKDHSRIPVTDSLLNNTNGE